MRLSNAARGAISAENARRQMLLRGATPSGHPLWNGVETGNLLNGHPDYDAVLALNKRRTRPAHYGKAVRLGISRPRRPEWDVNEISAVRRLFPRAEKLELLEALPKRTWGAICKRAAVLGLRRPMRKIKPSGSPLLDAIYLRAKAHRWTQSQIDIECRSGTYFSKRSWKAQGFNLAVHVRALKLLGGRLGVRWNKPPQSPPGTKRHGLQTR